MLDVVLSTVERGVVQSQPEHAVPAADVPPLAQLELQVEILSVSQVPTAVPQLADSAVVKPELWALARLVRRARNSPSAGRSRSAARRAMIIKCMMSDDPAERFVHRHRRATVRDRFTRVWASGRLEV